MVRGRFYLVPEAAQFHAAAGRSEDELSARVAAD